MLFRSREMFGLLADQGVGSIPWSPLAGGLVTRPWGERVTPRAELNRTVDQQDRPIFLDSDRAVVEAVQSIASARNVPMAQIAVAWVLKNPVVSAPIVGATKPHHLADAAAALDIELTPQETDALEAPYVTRRPTFF